MKKKYFFEFEDFLIMLQALQNPAKIWIDL